MDTFSPLFSWSLETVKIQILDIRKTEGGMGNEEPQLGPGWWPGHGAYTTSWPNIVIFCPGMASGQTLNSLLSPGNMKLSNEQ